MVVLGTKRNTRGVHTNNFESSALLELGAKLRESTKPFADDCHPRDDTWFMISLGTFTIKSMSTVARRERIANTHPFIYQVLRIVSFIPDTPEPRVYDRTGRVYTFQEHRSFSMR